MGSEPWRRFQPVQDAQSRQVPAQARRGGRLGINDVDDANDGAAALAKMRSKRYGLVISDWNMVPMSGYELLRELRNDPALKRTPFIMVTSESKTETSSRRKRRASIITSSSRSTPIP
jgi:CheY-like chemotaxis protein